MDLIQYEKQTIVDAWDDMSEVKNGNDYYDINFK
jgi:hypothetical protein